MLLHVWLGGFLLCSGPDSAGDTAPLQRSQSLPHSVAAAVGGTSDPSALSSSALSEREASRLDKFKQLLAGPITDLEVDMKFCDHVSMEILSPVFGILHPGFYQAARKDFSYEHWSQSQAHIPRDKGDFYYMRTFFAGSVVEVHRLTLACHQAMGVNLVTGIEAVWHNESHLNRYLLDHKPIKVLSPEDPAEMLLDQYRKKSKLFRTTVILAPLGDDFRYCERIEWDHQYKNYQLLFDYMNSHPEYNVKIQFGTLSDYFDALDKEDVTIRKNSQSMFPVLSGDFFTYADRDDHYWSGYFTSRPFYKRMDRILESHLRAAEILYYFALKQAQKYKISKFLSSSHYMALTEARRNLGLFQHHDAITGTAKDWVVVDYGTRLFHSLTNLKKIIGYSALLLILKDKNSYNSYSFDNLLDMDLKQNSQGSLPQKTVITLSAEPRYLVVCNPSEQDRISVVSVYVSSPTAQVSSASGKPVEIQMSAVWNTATTISQTAYEISFLVQMPPLGLKVYRILESASSDPHLAEYVLHNGNVKDKGIFNMKNVKSTEEDITLENSFVKLRFDQSGLLEEMISKEDSKHHEVKVQFSWYGTTSKKDKSGAYLFLPDGEAKPYVYTTLPFVRVQRGRFYSDVTCFLEHVTHGVRLYNIQGIDGQSVEVSNIVDIRKEHNREIAMRISSSINSQNKFYTDLNGYQIQPRMTMSKLPLQANVYPMTTMAYIQDTKHRLTLLSAQSLGVSSLKSGQIEVIMDRRFMQDDNRGLE
ncbi:alpha-mannosidase 2-like [Mirounga angustirostris]|uniref:alpha-mannosidase 2-like n=2 Tax=Mirounga angustirostris TaxID=9716 RepID=UPI00313E883F